MSESPTLRVVIRLRERLILVVLWENAVVLSPETCHYILAFSAQNTSCILWFFSNCKMILFSRVLRMPEGPSSLILNWMDSNCIDSLTLSWMLQKVSQFHYLDRPLRIWSFLLKINKGKPITLDFQQSMITPHKSCEESTSP